jgi:deazaflavin-dependent oxidoreductase (nitroreductase family)
MKFVRTCRTLRERIHKRFSKRKNALKLTVAIDRTIGRTIYRWHVTLYRLTRGLIGHKSPVGPMLILELRGRKSGVTRSVTLLYYQKDHRYYVVASNGGRPQHPQWLLNVRANPDVNVQAGAHRFGARARAIASTDEPELWRELVRHYGGWADYQKLTDRTIYMVELVPTQLQD